MIFRMNEILEVFVEKLIQRLRNVSYAYVGQDLGMHKRDWVSFQGRPKHCLMECLWLRDFKGLCTFDYLSVEEVVLQISTGRI